nr:biotin synthase BioB [uncultured Solibaculum sp.]
MDVKILGHDIRAGKKIGKEEALQLYYQPLEELCREADAIRRHYCSNLFDLCAIVSGKSGRCWEDCKFCAQSCHNPTHVAQYPLLPAVDIVAEAKKNWREGIGRYSIVTSGKRLSDGEVDALCETIREILRETGLSVCVSLGLLDEVQYNKLKEAGVSRVHNNLETSRSYFPHICTTHTFDDKIKSIRCAQSAGLEVCSGGIMGLGESPEDRIDLAFTLRGLGIKSIPINMLNPIPGTPLARNRVLTEEDMRRISAVYRFILPDAFVRLAGGRGLLPDQGRGCFMSGANAAISGDMLTTAGITVQTDLQLLRRLGYEVREQV